MVAYLVAFPTPRCCGDHYQSSVFKDQDSRPKIKDLSRQDQDLERPFSKLKDVSKTKDLKDQSVVLLMQQHIAEAKVLPQARLLNWPESIVYVELRSRVQTFLQELLEPLLEDPTSSMFFAEAEARCAQGACSQ